MQKISINEVVGPERYNHVRDQIRREIIALKNIRRVAVGDAISFVFENRDTVKFQIQEMLRTEHITDLDQIRSEVDVYNEMIPDDGELSATMFIEMTQQEQIRPQLVRLIGIDSAVSLHIGQQFVLPAQFEGGRSTEDNLSAVQYVRFSFSPEAKAAFRDDSQEVAIVIDHPQYRARTILKPETRHALAADL
ncbi:MAG: DUF3501 family protein [Candidatus Binatia bacterium]